METKVRCIQPYMDSEIKKRVTNDPIDENYERIVSKERAAALVNAGVCVLIDEQKQQEEQEEQGQQEEQEEQGQIVETAKLEPDAETAMQKKKTSAKKNK
jgi:hypothetical protein